MMAEQVLLCEDHGAGETSESHRTCIASGRKQPKAAMVRFVIGPDDKPVPDLEEKLPGRGLWLSAERHMVHTACDKNLFAKRARCRVDVDGELPARLTDLLARRCIRWVELARRAGQAVGGFDEVRRKLGASKGGVLLSARDGASDGREKLARIAGGRQISDALSATELGAAFGRERVVHALVSAGGLSDNLNRDLMRLSGLRQDGVAA